MPNPDESSRPPRNRRRKRKHQSSGQKAIDQGPDVAAKALLLRMLDGHIKLRRFPSGQWSVSGIHFIHNKVPERLLALRLIEEGPPSHKGITIWNPTALARLVFGKAEPPAAMGAAETASFLAPSVAPGSVSGRAC